MRSPGSRVRIWLRYATSSTGLKTKSEVRESWRMTPSTAHRMARSGSTPVSSAVVIDGPTGVVDSHVFPCSHCEVRPWRSRALTSLPTVNPPMAAAASFSPALRTCWPMTMTSSTSQSTFVRDGRQHDRVAVADEGTGIFGEHRRVRRDVGAGFLNVFQVVLPYAEHLGGRGTSISVATDAFGTVAVTAALRAASSPPGMARSEPTSVAPSSATWSSSRRAA